MRKTEKALAVLGMTVGITLGSWVAKPDVQMPPAPTPQVTVTVPAPSPIQTQRCAQEAPDTAKGFDAMFRSLPQEQWGAADVGISVALPDGRSVWLWGDTMSTSRFVHSTAIVQDGGCLHVSNDGAQLLPDDGEKYYWIEAAEARGESTLWIWAEEIVEDKKAEWGFRYTGYNRVAEVMVDQAGDVSFVGWIGRVKRALAANVEDLKILENGQIAYSPRLHPEFTLASGKVLKTEARNWTDGQIHSMDTYRPVFTEVAE